jgi:hypothetical protein
MNTTKNNIKSNKEKIKQGAILKAEDGDLFILAIVDFVKDKTVYCAVALRDGNRWVEPNTDIQKAISGLEFVKNDVVISIE